jgi:hypothetical protein
LTQSTDISHTRGGPGTRLEWPTTYFIYFLCTLDYLGFVWVNHSNILYALTYYKGLFINYIIHLGGGGVSEKMTQGGGGVIQKMTDDKNSSFRRKGVQYVLIQKH